MITRINGQAQSSWLKYYSEKCAVLVVEIAIGLQTSLLQYAWNVYLYRMQGGSRILKKCLGPIFLVKPHGLDLPTYVIRHMSIYGNMTSSSWSLPSLNKFCISCIFFGMCFHLEWPVSCGGTLSPIASGLPSSIYGCRFYLSNVSIRSTQGCSISCR